MKISVNISSVIGILVIAFATFFTCVFISESTTYDTMFVLSISTLILSCIIIKVCKGHNSSCAFLFIFLILLWIFHMGQVAIIVLNLDGEIPIDFRNYGTKQSIIKALMYYYLSQSCASIGILVYEPTIDIKNEKKSKIDFFKTSKILFSLGIMPRIYIDVSRVYAYMNFGYLGTYSVYIPTVLCSVAFFADAAVISLLLSDVKKSKKALVFWTTLVYKVFTMMSGNRQSAVCYIVILIMLYFFVIQRVELRNLMSIFLIGFAALIIVDAVGSLRSEMISIDSIIDAFINVDVSKITADTLGEYGSALSTLVLSTNKVPEQVPWGYGRSYVAGIVSVIPFAVNAIPPLRGTEAFTQLLPGSAYFGGSIIGESFYNFSWLGIFVSFIVGMVVSKIQKDFGRDIFLNGNKDKIFWATIISIFILLYIRGYFTDMVQTVVWLYAAISIINRNTVYVKNKKAKINKH